MDEKERGDDTPPFPRVRRAYQALLASIPADTTGTRQPVVIMFSGGRDSTIAAARVLQRGDVPLLVTVTSDHLVGIDRVHERLGELSGALDAPFLWAHVVEHEDYSEWRLADRSCLPCHRDYVTAGVEIAHAIGAEVLALGYARYQDEWAEQTPEAIGELDRTLRDVGISLELPVIKLPSKAAATDQLLRLGLSPDALEQKCLVQRQAHRLRPDLLREAIYEWRSHLVKAVSQVGSNRVRVRDIQTFRPACAPEEFGGC